MSEQGGTSGADTSGLARAYRPARALIGWMRPDDAVLTIARRDQGATDVPEYGERAAAARDAVASRTPGIDQGDLISDPPLELMPHIELLQANEQAQSYFKEGWRVAIADLPRVRAMQPSVYTDAAEERASEVDPADLASIARVSLPIPQPRELPAAYDQSKQAWLLSSRNPNLRITGQFGGQLQAGVVGFGFTVAVSQSFMQVAEFRGRYLLRDGYHRAYGLLRRGVTRAPVFFKEFPTIEDLHVPPGMLPQDAYLGERPAVLADYLDVVAASDVELPASQKMIVIQGLEITPLG